MTLQGDLRTVLHPRSAVSETVGRLIEAGEHAEPLTLSGWEIATLVTFIEAAKRVAEAAAQQRPDVNAAHAEVASLQYAVRQTTEAWAAAERQLWRKDLEAL